MSSSVSANNPVYKSQVDNYLAKMMDGSFDASKGVGGFTDGGRYIIREGHHRVTAAIIHGMATGDSNYSILNALLNNGRWTTYSSSFGSLNISRFPTIWH